MTDFDLMLEQLDAIHASEADLAALSAALRVTLGKLTKAAEGDTEASLSYMWGMPVLTE